MGDLEGYVRLATTLIGIGITTWAELRDLWRRQGTDDEILDAIAAEVDVRIARRDQGDGSGQS